jgi:hypothetical protein
MSSSETSSPEGDGPPKQAPDQYADGPGLVGQVLRGVLVGLIAGGAGLAVGELVSVVTGEA